MIKNCWCWLMPVNKKDERREELVDVKAEFYIA